MVSRFKKEYLKDIKEISGKEFTDKYGDECTGEIKLRTSSMVGFEVVSMWRIAELEDRERKWKKQKKQIRQLKEENKILKRALMAKEEKEKEQKGE